jgi:hypothetical protein
MDEFYAVVAGVPTRGAPISIGNFYGKARIALVFTTTPGVQQTVSTSSPFSFVVTATGATAILYSVSYPEPSGTFVAGGGSAQIDTSSVTSVRIFGTSPSSAGTYDFTVVATESGPGGRFIDRVFSLAVNARILPTWITQSFGTVNQSTTPSFSFTLQATSDSAIASYSMIVSGPAFGTVNGSTFSGTTPTVGGTYSWTFKATDQDGDSRDQTIAMTVIVAPTWLTLPNFGFNFNLNGGVGGFSSSLEATSDSPVTYSIVSSPGFGILTVFPGGTSFGADVLPTPRFTSTYSWVLRATDQQGDFTEQQFYITVNGSAV